jgi:hypothetical protein
MGVHSVIRGNAKCEWRAVVCDGLGVLQSTKWLSLTLVAHAIAGKRLWVSTEHVAVAKSGELS